MRRGRGIVALGAALWAWLVRGRFRVRSALGEQLATARLAVGRWLPVAVGIGLAVVSLYTDARLLPALLPALGLPCPQHTPGLTTPLFAAVAGLSGLLALAVTVSAGPLESALGRFPAVVGAPLLEDKPRDGLLALLLATLTSTLFLLIVSVTAMATPVAGAFVVAVLALATLSTLVGYVRWRGTLRRPKNLAWHLADQMNGWLLAATRRVRRDEEARIARKLRESYSENFARKLQLCRSLLGEDEDEAGEVLAAMFHTAMVYVPRKRRFNPDSEWFPLRVEAQEGHAPPLIPLYDEMMLGTGARQVRDRIWFEKTVTQAYEDLLRHAEMCGASRFYRVWTLTLQRMISSSFAEQEFGFLDRLLHTVREGAKCLERTPELADLVSVPARMVAMIEFEGLQVGRAEQTLDSGAPLNAKRLLNAGLPGDLVEVLLEVKELVRNQERIEGRSGYRTPPSALAGELERRARPREEKLREKYWPIIATISSEIVGAAVAGGRWEALASLVANDLATVDGLLLRGRPSAARRYLGYGLEGLETALETEDLPAEYKRRLVEGLRAPWLHALYRNQAGLVDAVSEAFARALAGRSASDQSARNDLIAVLAIGDIARDVRGDTVARDALHRGLEDAGFDVARFAKEALEAAKDDTFGRLVPMAEFTRYAEWAQPLVGRALDLDVAAKAALRSLAPPNEDDGEGLEGG